MLWGVIPSLGLIFLVLGTIFMGLATPTEAGAMGAVGAMLLAAVRGATLTTDTGAALPIRVSIGMATLSSEVCDAEKLVRHADEALYRAKADGRDCWRQ